MYQDFAEDVMDDWFYDTAAAPNQLHRRTYNAYDDFSDASDEEIDEAVYRVFRSGGGLFHVDPARVDISSRPSAIRAALTAGEHAPGLWVTGGPTNARWTARQGGFTGATRPERHGGRREHIHGTDGPIPRSAHIFYGNPPTGDFADFEDAMVDALDAEDTDEFFRRLVRGIGRVARGIGRGIGRVARVVAPIASAIPLPWTQAIGRVASVAGRLMADGADEFEAIDALVDLAEAEDLWDAAAPAIATMAVHGVMPQAARLPSATRQNLVRATTQAAQTIAQQQGTQAVRALPAVVQTAQRVARQQGLPPRALPQVIQQVGDRLSRNPQMVRRLLRSASPALRQNICAACSQGQRNQVSQRQI